VKRLETVGKEAMGVGLSEICTTKLMPEGFFIGPDGGSEEVPLLAEGRMGFRGVRSCLPLGR
jgi:hypothetical protein